MKKKYIICIILGLLLAVATWFIIFDKPSEHNQCTGADITKTQFESCGTNKR
jgi:hypothetical protein